MARKSTADSFFRPWPLAALAQQATQRAPAWLRVVALQVGKVQPVDQSVRSNRPGERAGELERRSEGEPHDGCPADPCPATGTAQLRVHDAERCRLQPQPDPRLQ